MSNNQPTSSRRNFLSTTSLGLGAGFLGLPKGNAPRPKAERLPREVWIGSVSLMGLRAKNPKAMVKRALDIMEQLLPYEPDIICLPECFAFTNLEQAPKLDAVAGISKTEVIPPIAAFAREHGCYVICPAYVEEAGNLYIAATLLDRQGKTAGQYLKARPAESEMAAGIQAGPLEPPVFETDFGKIGIQICFDIKWDAGWQHLKGQGAELIFWPSAYAGGREIISRAWRHQVHLVTSTQKDTSRICDLSGEVIAQTTRWQPNWICAPVNLEKVFLHSWPAVQKFPSIQKKYGRSIRLTTFAEEEWTIIESVDPEVRMADILKEFELQPHHDFLAAMGAEQEGRR